MAWNTLDDLDLAGKNILVRVDINVPVKNGLVTDATRIEKIVPTVRDILARGGKPILLAHFDRPKGKVVPSMSLSQLLPSLTTALHVKVVFAADCVGPIAQDAVQKLQSGEVLLLENTRFHKGEEENDPAFAHHIPDLQLHKNFAYQDNNNRDDTVYSVYRMCPPGRVDSLCRQIG